MSAQQQPAGASAEQATGPEFVIQRIYIKDASLEVPDSPNVFLQEWRPELKLDLGTNVTDLGDNAQEVVLTVTATVNMSDKVALLVEVKQAGIFTIKDFPEDQLRPMLGSYCPSVLYPYAREVVTDLVMKAGFPQLYLSPVNFDALFEQHENQEGAEQPSADAKEEGTVN